MWDHQGVCDIVHLQSFLMSFVPFPLQDTPQGRERQRIPPLAQVGQARHHSPW